MSTTSRGPLPVVQGPASAGAPGARWPSKLFVEVTTRCNLHCAMCVKEVQGLAEGHLSRETFDRLAPAFPHLDALVLNGIGEPLLHRELEGFVEAAKREMPARGWVGFQTNGQLLGPARARSLAAAGVDRVCISADAVSPELFRTLRAGGKQQAVEIAAESLHLAGRERGRPIAVGVEFVAVRDNLQQLPDVVRWAARHHVGFVLVSQMLPYARELAAATAYDVSTDRARELLRSWSERATAEGVDLRRYFEVFMRFRPSADDQRVIDWVRRMVADAWEQGVSLNVQKLLAADDGLLGRVEAVFAEAEEVARAEGVDLRLPAAVPTRARRCDFVEEGAAFVSWKGDLHPCYFLWHGYSCYVAGAAQKVRPRTFGNAADGVLDVWNGGEWRSFREAVLRYDYPFCHDCNHALCDFVSGEEEFAQDCHLGTVPCGACLWPTGLFQCLR
jgi:putative metalloenzyme radical SAM/SPASM domain maturase